MVEDLSLPEGEEDGEEGDRKKKAGSGRGGQMAVRAHAVRAMVQILITTGKAYTVETLRERLRNFFVGENDGERRSKSLQPVQRLRRLLGLALAATAPPAGSQTRRGGSLIFDR